MQRSPLQELNIQNGTILGLNIKQAGLVDLDSAQPRTVEFASVDASTAQNGSVDNTSKPAAPKTPLKPSGQTGKPGQYNFWVMLGSLVGIWFRVCTTVTPHYLAPGYV